MIFVLAIIESDGLLVAFERVHQADNQPGCSCNVAQLRMVPVQSCGYCAEMVLVHIRMRSNHRHQTARELNVCGQVAFQPGSDQAKLLAHFRAFCLVMEDPVLVFGEQSSRDRDGNCNRGRNGAWP